MKTHKLKYLILSFGVVFFSSCTQLLYTSLDVLHPASVSFDKNANNLILVNNTINQPAFYGHKTSLLNKDPQNISMNTDSMALFCLGALKEDMDGNNFFNSVQFIPETQNKEHDFNVVNPLMHNKVMNLCYSNNVDVVLSLDKIKVNDELNEYYLSESNTYLATLEFHFETYWSIHYPNKEETTKIQFKDTVYWESESYLRRKAVPGLPSRDDALVDGALNVGHKCMNRFIPYWEKADRYFFSSSNKLMKQGMDSVYVKNWPAAIDLWLKEFDKTKNNRLKAEAANNIAIGYEITGNLDKALEYATTSYYTFGDLIFTDMDSFFRLSEYINILTQRKEDIGKLKEQLGE